LARKPRNGWRFTFCGRPPEDALGLADAIRDAKEKVSRVLGM